MPDNRSETYSKGNQSNDIAGFLVSNADLSVIQNCRQLYKISPGGSDGKESACNAEDLGLILGSGRSPGEQNGNTLQYSCLENPMDRGAWRATVHGSQRVTHNCMTNTTSPIYVMSSG